MILPAVTTEFTFHCDGVIHLFRAPGIVLTESCDCPSLWTGALEDCPGCGGKGFTLVSDGAGHRDELDCPRCAPRRPA